jgi:cytochrome b6-f complex iron-sulfur subunit
MNRREVIQKFIAGGTVLVLVPSVIESCVKNTTVNNGTINAGTPISVDLTQSTNAALNKSGGSVIVQNILVINVNNNFVALSSICTHQGCTVAYNSVANDIECPCHGSVFSTSGSVVVGPAISPLQSFAVTKSGTVLTITL